jgi:hypothetical protein
MTHQFFYIWLIPFFLPVVGFGLAKIPFLKKTRIVIDIIILFIAFMLDLQNNAFKSELYGILFGFIVVAIILKFSWSALKLKVKLFRYVILISGLVIFIAKYGEWMVTSADTVYSWHFPVSVQTHSGNASISEIREYKMVRQKKQLRIFKLVDGKKNSIIMRKLDSFTVPKGYENSPFKYRWFHDQTGINAALIGGEDTLWTLKEVR